MSPQFGIWKFDGGSLPTSDLERMGSMLAAYGLDDTHGHDAPGMHIRYCGFHTTRESRRESQPCSLLSGSVVTWDGRLDDRKRWIEPLRGAVSEQSSDSEIVSAVWEIWGVEALPKMVGDWALSVWDARKQALLLAKDFAGTRQLFYRVCANEILWSSILDPLIEWPGDPLDIEEEYVAGWLGFLPRADLTPYRGIQSVPPSCYVLATRSGITIREHWCFDPSVQLYYRTDAEYEQHFRIAFAESIKRRLRSEQPILSELSGGMDSSSIVCVADSLLARGETDAPRLDTISYYDDREPNWNELPLVKEVEQKRGRVGFHLNARPTEGSSAFPASAECRIAPAYCRASQTHAAKASLLRTEGYRVLLSGLGGDEVLGGVPAPGPELSDALAAREFHQLYRKLTLWAIVQRRPVLHLFADIVNSFLPRAFASLPPHLKPPRWLAPRFVRQYRQALEGYETRLHLTGPRPSFQENVSTFDVIRRQLGCQFPSREFPSETRYPYLDRDLVVFLYSIPREQIVRPEERRSLMRRALRDIVPAGILNRKRKAFVVQAAIQVANWRMQEMRGEMLSGELGIVNPKALAAEVEDARSGKTVNVVAILRALELECWLRHRAGTNAFGNRTLEHPAKFAFEPARGRTL